MMLENYGVSENNWRDALDPVRASRGLPAAPPNFAMSETPAMWDVASSRWHWTQSAAAGTSAPSRPLSSPEDYGFTDIDGSQPIAGSR